MPYLSGGGVGFLASPFRRHEAAQRSVTAESAHQLIEEASLFVEAGHACHLRMAQQKAPAAPPAAAAQVVTLEL